MTIPELAERSCVPCRGGVPALTAEEIGALAPQLQGWSVVGDHHLEKTLRFPDFAAALRFADAVGTIADEQGHHPEIVVAWGRATLRITTHKAGGLTESDFILAAKIDRIRT